MKATVLAALLLTGAAQASVFQRSSAVSYGGSGHPQMRLTAAHCTLPLGSWVRVTHAHTGRSVDVLINDRGPFGSAARVIVVSRPAAAQLGTLAEGVAPVTLRVLSRP